MKTQFTDRALFTAVLFLSLAAAAFVLGLHQLGDDDFLWHLKTGQLILQQGVPKVDPYSFRTSGKEWIDAQWLFQVFIYSGYRVAGFRGLSVVLAGMTALLWLLLFALVRDEQARGLSFLLAMVALWTISPRLNLRPEMFTYLLTVVFLIILEQDRKRRSKFIFLLPALQALWANLEGLWPVGLVIIAAYFAEEIFFASFAKSGRFSDPASPARPQRLLLVLIVCALASVLTPYHFRGFFFPITLLRQIAGGSDFARQDIGEFYPLFSRTIQVPFIALPFLVLAIVSGLSFVLNRGRVRPSQWLLWPLFLYLSVSARRNIPFFCIYSLLVFATNFGEWLRSISRLLDSARAKFMLQIFPVAAGLGLSLFLVIANIGGKFNAWNKSFHQFGTGLQTTWYPVEASDFLKRIGWKGKIFNQMGTGGYLVWEGYPDWKIYADGRLELYGVDGIETSRFALSDYMIFSTEDLRWQFDAVLLDTRDKPVRRLIDRLLLNPAWAPVYHDRYFMVFLKDTPAQHSLVEKYGLKIRVDWR